MRMYRRRSVVVALFGLLTSAAVATPALAEVGAVSVVFTKGGFVVGVGGVAKGDLPAQRPRV